jgi:hypothetical protein
MGRKGEGREERKNMMETPREMKTVRNHSYCMKKEGKKRASELARRDM